MDDIPGINGRFVSNVASVGLHQWMLAMLRAYFDDSGTHTGGKHGPSKIVLVAGIFGTEGRMDGLDRMWKKRLASPIRGRKARLNRFHASDCSLSTPFRDHGRMSTKSRQCLYGVTIREGSAQGNRPTGL